MILTTGTYKDLGVAGLVSALHSPEYKQAMDAALNAPSGSQPGAAIAPPEGHSL